ncbi:hypothetical protein BEH94_00750 [Candidatus Altiarchaeales archaeon WOR_SM1_SCG]|nr:hypothetical protein BEH94_00750 [Candidatus Altiarchaeales archaeon WOR_SM1_SCG]
MTQWLKASGLGGGGIIAVLFIMGVILVISGVSETTDYLGYISLTSAVVIGIIYALLGVCGILRRNKSVPSKDKNKTKLSTFTDPEWIGIICWTIFMITVCVIIIAHDETNNDWIFLALSLIPIGILVVYLTREKTEEEEKKLTIKETIDEFCRIYKSPDGKLTRQDPLEAITVPIDSSEPDFVLTILYTQDHKQGIAAIPLKKSMGHNYIVSKFTSNYDTNITTEAMQNKILKWWTKMNEISNVSVKNSSMES